MDFISFRKIVFSYYETNKRDLPWRRTSDPYEILVSEVMLQQTQVSRVREKYLNFLKLFPTINDLAVSSPAKVISAWQGLGYNRRALALRNAAVIVKEKFSGTMPETKSELEQLPGVGQSTAGAILAYAHNQPVVFIETNIRRVFIHHFFNDKENIPDAKILPIIEQALDRENPREWYWALMDYGSMLARTVPNPNRKSRHYSKQSAFEGSRRQLRGKILRLLTERKRVSRSQLVAEIQKPEEELEPIINELKKEGFITAGKTFSLKK